MNKPTKKQPTKERQKTIYKIFLIKRIDSYNAIIMNYSIHFYCIQDVNAFIKEFNKWNSDRDFNWDYQLNEIDVITSEEDITPKIDEIKNLLLDDKISLERVSMINKHDLN